MQSAVQSQQEAVDDVHRSAVCYQRTGQSGSRALHRCVTSPHGTTAQFRITSISNYSVLNT